jgi:hypothetical protein
MELEKGIQPVTTRVGDAEELSREELDDYRVTEKMDQTVSA